MSVTPEEALALLAPARRGELRARAAELTRAFRPARFDFCAIVSARQGRCTEDCAWCAQAARWRTDCAAHGWIGADACVAAARAAETLGAGRLGIVTSGRAPDAATVEAVCAAVRRVRAETRVRPCASLGLVDEAGLRRLKAAGLERVHCNIETAPSRFREVCTTHTFEEKLAVLETARRLGFQICCGGILGMGETDAQLVEFAFALRRVAPDSIPVNILHPIPGTPLGAGPAPSAERVLDSIALLRVVNPRTPLRFAGGRRTLDAADARRAIELGIDAGIVGALLTTPGAEYACDRALAREAGYSVEPDLRAE